ncbi:hypothetical protein [Streptomyces sp. NPDC001070]
METEATGGGRDALRTAPGGPARLDPVPGVVTPGAVRERAAA